jgi:hypothetical protein
VEATCRINYPRELLEIQVLDDSTDGTTEIAQACVARHRDLGFDIHYINRGSRTGFKAGALEHGLKSASGEFIAIFDADFIPAANFLEDVIDYFSDSEIGMIQVRWGHINRDYSLLTQVESVLMDGHFMIEHGGRHFSGRFFNFNGTAGIWRRQAIETAGGWEHDTLTEDTDLSYRAQLMGWKFLYLPHIVCPAELPVEMNSFKTQHPPDSEYLLPPHDRAFLSAAAGDDRAFQSGLVSNVVYRLAAVAGFDGLGIDVLPDLTTRAVFRLANPYEVSALSYVDGNWAIGKQFKSGDRSPFRNREQFQANAEI